MAHCTKPICKNGCIFPQNCPEDRSPSAPAPSDPAGPLPVVGSGGWLEVLGKELRAEAKQHRHRYRKGDEWDNSISNMLSLLAAVVERANDRTSNTKMTDAPNKGPITER